MGFKTNQIYQRKISKAGYYDTLRVVSDDPLVFQFIGPEAVPFPAEPRDIIYINKNFKLTEYDNVAQILEKYERG